MSVWRHLRAIVALPGTVTIVVPTTILFVGGGPNIGASLPSPWSGLAALAGCASIAIGLFLSATSVSLFARIGLGTLAPWDPTQRLVVRGPYRYVRNPMISGVFAVLLGEAVFFGSAGLLVWFLLFVSLNLVFIPLWEEPDLERRLGPECLVYKQNVPRWVPRLTPWEGASGENRGFA